MSKLDEIKRAYGYNYRLDVNTYPFWLINRVEELEEEVEKAEYLTKLERKRANNMSQKNQRYKQALDKILCTNDFEDAIEYAEKVIDIVTQALKEGEANDHN